MPTAPYRSWVEVSRERLTANLRAVRRTVGPDVAVMPVVKADAYRHGAVEVSRVLAAEGVDGFAVSNVEEGVALREAAGIRRELPILVMADFLPVERRDLVAFGLTPVLHSLADIAAWNQIAVGAGRVLPYHLKIDTGMGRLGVFDTTARIVDAVVTQAEGARLEGLMTHFASSADYGSPQTAAQTARFVEVVSGLESAGVRPRYLHQSSTIPVAYRRTEAWGNLVRPGHAIYGYVSPARGGAPDAALDVRPALSWKAAVLTVKWVPAGTPIGYGAMYRTPRETRLAVLAAGYADGIPHRLGNRGFVIVQGKLAPIIGAVSMDVTTVDITDVDSPLEAGDSVTLLGEENGVHIDAQQMARSAGTISYSLLCGISARVRRVYV